MAYSGEIYHRDIEIHRSMHYKVSAFRDLQPDHMLQECSETLSNMNRFRYTHAMLFSLKLDNLQNSAEKSTTKATLRRKYLVSALSSGIYLSQKAPLHKVSVTSCTALF